MRTRLTAGKEFAARFRRLSKTHDSREVWMDFLVVSFCSLRWADGEICLAEIAAREARYTLKENELLAEMFVLAAGGGRGMGQWTAAVYHGTPLIWQ